METRRRKTVPAAALLALLTCAGLRGSARAQDQQHLPDLSDTLTASTSTVPKRDINDVVNTMFHREPKPEVVTQGRKRLQRTFLPVIGYNPSYGALVGASVAMAGWLGDQETTRMSAAGLGASYSTTERIAIQFRSDLYLPNNTWSVKGDWRYLDTNQPTFGLGPKTADQTEYPMDFVLYRFYETVYHRVHLSPVYVGVGYHFDLYDKIVDSRAEAGEVTPYSAYSRGTPTHSQSSGTSVNVLVDTRDNPINGHRGVFWNASMRSFFRALGSDNDRQTLWSDFRGYIPVTADRRNILAVWNYMWFTFGEPPYLDLPAIGWDTWGRSGRGFLQGRIRGPNQTYTEFEYRARFTRDDFLGGVAFLSLTSTTPPNGAKFGTPDYGGGVGLRMKFNKKTDTNATVDIGWGQDNSARIFFGLQEVF